MVNIQFMLAALEQAKKAALNDEVPVGAVLVLDDEIIAKGHNLTIFNNDPSAHAEVLVIREACRKLGNYRLTQCTLYVTLEPCCMCAGTIMQARLQKIYFGAYDKKSGVAGSDLNLFNDRRLNHQTKCVGGIMADNSKRLLQNFFLNKRRLSREI